MSLRIKCFVSGEMRPSGKACRCMQGSNDRELQAMPPPGELKKQVLRCCLLCCCCCVFYRQGFPSCSPDLQDGMRQASQTFRTTFVAIVSHHYIYLHSKNKVRAGEMVQWVKHWPYQHEDQTLNTHNRCKSWVREFAPVIPAPLQ